MYEHEFYEGDFSVFETDHPRELNTNFIEATNALIGQTKELITALNNEREPDVAKHEFVLYGRSLHSLQLPQYIADSLITKEVSTVAVRTETSIHGPFSPTLAIDIFTREATSELLDEQDEADVQPPTVSVQVSPESQETIQGVFYNIETDKETAISIPQSQLRKTVASLIFPIIDGDYERFADLDLVDEKNNYNITRALMKVADFTTTEARFYFWEQGSIDGWLNVTLDGSTLTSAELYDKRKSNEGVSADSKIIDEEAGIQMQMILDDSSLGIGFYECCGPVGADNIAVPYAPDLKDFSDLQEYIASKISEIQDHGLTQTVPLQEHHAITTHNYMD